MTLLNTLKTTTLMSAAGTVLFMMNIADAMAQDVSVPSVKPEYAHAAGAPTAMEAFMWNMGLVLVLVLMFYVLLVRPQQKRFKEHAVMLSGLKKGDAVVTNGGLVGQVDRAIGDEEMLIDLGSGVKVTVLRSAIQARKERVSAKSANDAPKPASAKPAPKKEQAPKKPASKKPAKKVAKKAAPKKAKK